MKTYFYWFAYCSCLFFRPIHAFVSNNKFGMQRTSPLFFEKKPNVRNENGVNENDVNENGVNKLVSVSKLLRVQSIAPTIALCLSGGWILHPSLSDLIVCRPYIVSIIDTVLVMSASMGINDMFDIEVDRINNPDRPLVRGDILMAEAAIISCTILVSAEFLSLNYLPPNLQLAVHIAIANILLYTPVIKRIPFLKNISCAGLISFAVFFSGIAATPTVIVANNNYQLFLLTTSTIFLGSMYNELLLDLCDREGDAKSKIPTVPVLFGNDFALGLAASLMLFATEFNCQQLFSMYNVYYSLPIVAIFSSAFQDVYTIKKDGYSKSTLDIAIRRTNQQLILFLLYICILAANAAG